MVLCVLICVINIFACVQKDITISLSNAIKVSYKGWTMEMCISGLKGIENLTTKRASGISKGEENYEQRE